MNTTKSVYNKLFKEETQLSSHEIELASVGRVKVLSDAALKFNDKTVAANNKAKQAIVDLNNLLSQGIANYVKVVTEVDELEVSAKDLGIQLPNEVKVARDAAKREIAQQTELKNKVSSIKL
jgi:predicted phage-related endonuclease